MISQNLNKPEAIVYNKKWSDPNYSASNSGYTKYFQKFIQKYLGNKNIKLKILDVGCGDGYFCQEFIKMGYIVSGIDISIEALKIAKKNNPKGNFIIHDLSENLPFKDNYFDFIWCSEVLEHLLLPYFLLCEIKRVLQTNGKLFLTVPYHGLLKNIAIALFNYEKHYDPEYVHIRFFSIKSLSGIVNKAGFSINTINTCGSNLGIRDYFFPTNILLTAQKID
jgi:2-polyprenyl-3-methyl-5-hydroxy-6-metoxy-1,4-benzoquinol methylase